MSNTYTRIYVQAVFTPNAQQCLIQKEWEEKLFKYITGIVQNNGHKLLAINGMPDHVHVFISMMPDQSLSVLIRDVKANSSRWINENKFTKTKFSWQKGFGAFSYSHSQYEDVINYIAKQKEYHKKNSFKDEYILFLKKFEVEYKNEYLFKFFD